MKLVFWSRGLSPVVPEEPIGYHLQIDLTHIAELWSSEFVQRVVVSIVLLVALVTTQRAVAARLMRTAKLHPTGKVRVVAYSRNLAIGIGLLLGLLVWGQELRELLLSLVVFASAVVVATKELIMCVSGSLVRAVSRSFEIGSRVEIAGVRGDVIDHGVWTTTLLEIGPGHQRTGRTLVFPNSMLLSGITANETFTKEYVLHTFDVPVSFDADLSNTRTRLLQAARKACAAHEPLAEEQLGTVSRQHGLLPFDTSPRVTLHFENATTVRLRVRVPTPSREKGLIEQEILTSFVSGLRPQDLQGSSQLSSGAEQEQSEEA